MAMVGDLVAVKLFEDLCIGVKDLIGKNLELESLLVNLESVLESLAPLIEEITNDNQQLDPKKKKELEDLERLIKKGKELVDKCSKLRTWNIFKKFKYARKFLKFNESLQKQLEVLQVQVARNVKKIEVAVENIQGTVQSIQEEMSIKQKQSSDVEALSAVLPELPSIVVRLDGPLKELKAKLLEDGVTMLIMTAPGGCGKTTLAIKLCQDEQIKDLFKKNIFFVTISKKHNLESIMTELYKQKGYAVPSFHNGVHPVKWMEKVKMENGDNPSLLVLDDVWSGSESLLEKFGSSFKLPLLDHDKAMKLFRHTASLEDKSSHIPRYLSEKIVNHCKGYPLAITVSGRSLCGQSIQTWQDREIQLLRGSTIFDFETELLLCLQTNIDALKDEMPMVKDCLLDLGAFPEDVEIDVTTLMDMWAELYDLDEETSCIAKLYELNNRNLANLFHRLKRCLPKHEEFGDYRDYLVRQHDLLRELAIYNSKLDPVETRERLIIDICANNFPQMVETTKASKHQCSSCINYNRCRVLK